MSSKWVIASAVSTCLALLATAPQFEAACQPILPESTGRINKGGFVMTTWALLGIIVAVAIYGVMMYNRLVKSRQMAQEGWSGIDVQLRRRTNLIPNLLESVKGYLSHEKDIMEDVTRLRANAQAVDGAAPADRAKAESALSGGLLKLNAVMENYPDLKANQNVLELQESLQEIEDQIQMARRYYNGSVRDLNVLVESFPSNLLANSFSFQKADYFELDDATQRQLPKVEF
jgi:LemA protein